MSLKRQLLGRDYGDDDAVRIVYDPLPWSIAFHSGTWVHACLVGGVGGGKTFAALQELKACALENPGFTYLIGRKTLPALRVTTLKAFFAVFEDRLIAEFNRAQLTVKLVNGTEFLFMPLDDLEKFKSMEIAGFYVNEANEIEKEMYDTLKSRVRQKVGGKEPKRYRTIIDLNPTEEDHWIPQLFLHSPQKGSQMFHSTTIDNLANLPTNYLEELEKTYSPEMRQRMIYGLFTKVFQGRAVFPQFSKGNYVASAEFDPFLPLIRGWDFGYGRPAVVWAQLKNDQIRILAELMGKDVYLEDFVKDQVRPYEATLFRPSDPKQFIRYMDFCDPHGSDQSDKGKTSTGILHDLGIRPAYRRTSIEEGLKAIKSKLDTLDRTNGQPNYLIHPRCKVLIEGFRGGYARKDGEDAPAKDGYYDHLMDAMRYLVLHVVQRARANMLGAQAESERVHVNPVTGRRIYY